MSYSPEAVDVGVGTVDSPLDATTGKTRPDGKAILMLELLIDLWGFMRERKKFWLAPIVIILLLLGALIVLTERSALAPFIYTIF